MLHGPLLGRLVMFALPVILGSILQQVFNAADTAVVGRFASSQALAAVGGNASTISLLLNLFIGITSGAGVVVATYIGQRHEERISSAVHTSMLFSLICGFFLAFIGQITARPLLRLMSSPEDVIELAAVYLKIYFAGMPFLLLYNMGASILRGTGDAGRPLYSLLFAGVVNVILNLIFVVGFRLSVIGVALATVISNALSAGLVVFFLMKEKGPLKLELRKLRLDRNQLAAVLRIGLPSGIQGTVFSISNVCIQTAINGFGSVVVAGSAISLNFEYMCYFAINGFIQACLNFTGQNYGAGQTERCRKVYWQSLFCGTLSCFLFNCAFYFARSFTLGLFTRDPAVIAVAEERMRCILMFQSLAASYEIAAAALRGMGRAMVPAVLTVFGSCLFRILWIWTVFRAVPELPVLFYVYPASWILTGILVTAAYFHVRKQAEAEAGTI
ncbi:MAG: MATE family efflux transporter [Stomatobaculum sp.]|nr:MATE family efflux transporter [Stomatobaculum sp.]